MTVFLISLFVASSLILLDMLLVRVGIKNLRDSPQTLHVQSVSRFGGIAIFLSLLIASNLSNESEYEFLRKLLLCTSPVFLVGFIDDMKISIPPIIRLMLIIPSALLCYYFLGTKAENLEIPLLDYLFQFELFAIVFICIALSGMINAFNMLDGINGLLLLFCLSTCISIISTQRNIIRVLLLSCCFVFIDFRNIYFKFSFRKNFPWRRWCIFLRCRNISWANQILSIK